MATLVLRILFLVVAAGIGVLLIPNNADNNWETWGVFGGVMCIAACTIALDMLVPRKQLDTISSVYFGLLVGLLLTYILDLALSPLAFSGPVRSGLTLVLGMVLCYTCVSLLLQTKNDFRFVIPYVEFSRELRGPKPYILDTSVVIDGRIADVAAAHLFDDTQLVVPRFVMAELQNIADSGDKLRRGRGRRGLDVLNRLRNDQAVDLQIFDRELPEFAGHAVDMKLVILAKHLSGKVVTNDFNLNKVAKVHGVLVVNLNDLSNALKPVFLPGEQFQVRLIKAGEEQGQGVGYLDDGTMVVVESGRDHVGKPVKLTVTSVLQTSAGRMVFGRFDHLVEDGKAAG